MSTDVGQSSSLAKINRKNDNKMLCLVVIYFAKIYCYHMYIYHDQSSAKEEWGIEGGKRGAIVPYCC